MALDVVAPAGFAGADEALARVAHRFRGQGGFARHYVASKLKRDPMHRAVLALAAASPFGSVLDLGCGFGQVGLALLEAGGATSVTGLDVAAGHLGAAQAAANGLAFAAQVQDLARPRPLPVVDTVLLIDVLYQLDDAAQAGLLRQVAQAARRRVVIRTQDPQRGWRSGLTRLMERGFRVVWPTSGATVNPWPVSRVAGALAAAGFAVRSTPCWEGTPFSNVLLVAERF